MTVSGRFRDATDLAAQELHGRPLVAIVLPPRESFSATGAGAIGLIVRRLATADGRYHTCVVGRPTQTPFPEASFCPIRSPLLSLGYGADAARTLGCLRPTLIEVHNRPALALRLARLGAPVVLVLHNDPQGMRGCRTARARVRLAARLAGVVCVSAWVRDRLGLPGAHVVPNPIDLAALPAPFAERDRKIVFVGRLVADKGADAFVAACAHALPALPGWTAEMIGADRFGADSPDTPFLRRLRPAAAAAGVRLAGWQPHAAVLAAMARAAILVVPSRWPEPFGMTALEAMASGAALAYAPRGGLPEVVGDSGLAIDPENPAAMADALVALARDPARRAALGAAGLARAQEFDVAHVLARWDALRCTILDAWPGRAGAPI